MSTNSTLYAEDFYAWCLTTAELIRSGKWSDIDADAVAEEIEDMARRDKRQLEHRIQTSVIHLLKWCYQPEEHQYHGHSWRSTINEQRDRLELLLRDNPSLRPQLPEVLAERYPKARKRASEETGKPLETFPETCPWTVEQVLDDDFWP
jgi:hypothetical protein